MKHKHTEAEIEAIKEDLRAILPPGSTAYTILRHVSRSGMQRAIDVYALIPDGDKVAKFWITPKVAAVCGYSINKRHDALTVNGCGMDMGFDVVYNLSYALYGRSVDPTTGETRDGGYTLKHQWL